MNQLEDTQTDLAGFPPGLAAPIRPAVPRRTVGQPQDSLPCRGETTSSPEVARRAPAIAGSLVIDIDDDLEELDEVDDLDDELELDGDAADPLRARGDGVASPEPRLTVTPGAASVADRARRLGSQLASRVIVPVAAIAILVIAMGGTWSTAGATPAPPLSAGLQPAHAGATTHAAATDEPEHATRSKSAHKELTGKLNLNTASEDQLMVLPSVGPAKAERIVTWRKKNGGFKRTADLRRVKGFGYKTFKKLEPYLDIKGDTTLAPK